MGSEKESLGLADRFTGLELLHCLVELADLAHGSLRLLPQLTGFSLQGCSSLKEQLLIAVHYL